MGPTIQDRSFAFARRVIQAMRLLDECRLGRTLGSQFLRSGTSIGANVEEAQAAHSKADFSAKHGIARKEARETLYWLRLFKAESLLPQQLTDELIRDCDGIVATLTAIVKSAQNRTD